MSHCVGFLSAQNICSDLWLRKYDHFNELSFSLSSIDGPISFLVFTYYVCVTSVCYPTIGGLKEKKKGSTLKHKLMKYFTVIYSKNNKNNDLITKNNDL